MDGLRRLDAQGIAEWLIQALARYSGQPVQYLVPVGHGAGAAVVRDDALAFAPLDYEQELPEDVASAYLRDRDPFRLTGSPALPSGLNLGAQLALLQTFSPGVFQSGTLVPWAQYWAWFLSGTTVTEVTSLGCHTDLWSPRLGTYSPLAERRGWAAAFAPLTRAGAAVGRLRPELVAATGLPATAQVLAGLHDSNAALLAARGFGEIALKEATVLSTGTWFIGMRLPDEVVFQSSLPEGRDCLVNVDAYGRAVPSARFMGGREIESIIGIDTRRVDIKPDQPRLLAEVPGLLASGAMLLPTLAPGNGPFPECKGGWVREPEDWYARRAAACLYAALVADASLDLIGSKERLLIEGRFAEAQVFVRALASLRPDTQVYTANAHNDVSFGALRLIDPTLSPQGSLVPVEPLDWNLASYRSAWHAEREVAA